MNLSISRVANRLWNTDVERMGKKDGNEGTMAANMHAGFVETLSSIPGVSQISGVYQCLMGTAFAIVGLAARAFGSPMDRPAAKGLVSTGVKHQLLGLSAVFLPVAGNVINGVAAVKDWKDTVHNIRAYNQQHC